jgi:hypothetical protein
VRQNRFLLCIGTVVMLFAALSGCVISPRRTVGGGSPTPTPSGSPTATPTPGTATGKLYVSNQNVSSIVRFDNALSANGNVAPAATIAGSNTGLSSPQFMILDTTADRLFVANLTASSILIWDTISTRNGNIAPTRTLSGANTGLTNPIAVALDKARDLLYVADGPEVFVFASASTVSGNAAPVRAIVLAGGFNIEGMFLDTAGDRLFFSDAVTNAIHVYDSASTLNSPSTGLLPNRSFTGGLSQPSGLTFDSFGNLVVANQGNGTITIYANPSTANGTVTPLVTISGTSTTLLAPSQVIPITGSSTDDVIVADSTAGEVAVFPSINTRGGNVSPSRTISGLNGVPRGVALDPTR